MPGVAARFITISSRGGDTSKPSTAADLEAAWDAAIEDSDGGLRVRMSGRGLSDDQMAKWCTWFETSMKSTRKLVAQDVNFSSNSLTSTGVQRLLSTFAKMGVEVRVLKLWQNRIGKGSGMAQFLASCCGTLRELHLSNNQLDSQAMLEIMVAAASARDKRGDWCYPRGNTALWLRLEHNASENAEALNTQFLAELTRLGRTRSCICHVDGSATCRPHACAHGNPAIHLTYLMSNVPRLKTSTVPSTSIGPSVSISATRPQPRPVPGSKPALPSATSSGPAWGRSHAGSVGCRPYPPAAGEVAATGEIFPALGAAAVTERVSSSETSVPVGPTKIDIADLAARTPKAEKKKRGKWVVVEEDNKKAPIIISEDAGPARESQRPPPPAHPPPAENDFEPAASEGSTWEEATTADVTVSSLEDDADGSENTPAVVFKVAEAVVCRNYDAEAEGYCSLVAGEEVGALLEQPEAGDVHCAWPEYVFVCDYASGSARGWAPQAVLWRRYVDDVGRPWLHHGPTDTWHYEDHIEGRVSTEDRGDATSER